MPAPDPVIATVIEVLCDSLGLDQHEVTLSSRLGDDLGVDSLDVLDILFSLERRLSITLRDAQLERMMRGEAVSKASLDAGVLTTEDREALEVFLPALRAAPAEVTPGQLAGYLTVETLVIAVRRRLDA